MNLYNYQEKVNMKISTLIISGIIDIFLFIFYPIINSILNNPINIIPTRKW